MTLAELLKKRLIFVSGKGGVGKTSVVALLGQLAASLKKNTLLIEMNASGRIGPIFQAETTPDDVTAMGPHLSAVNLRPKDCFEEYVLRQIRFKSIYDLFFNNKFVTNFIDATPGLAEILMLGKIYDFERLTKGRASSKLHWDLIIVDAAATGHGLSTLEVPHVILSATKAGPLHSNALRMNELFGDADKTAFCLVTLAEEMPVAETEEYAQGLRKKTDLHFGPLFVNAVMPHPGKVKAPKANALNEDLRLYWEYYVLAKNRAELNRDYLKEIKNRLPELQTIILPFQFEGLSETRHFKPLLDELRAELRHEAGMEESHG